MELQAWLRLEFLLWAVAAVLMPAPCLADDPPLDIYRHFVNQSYAGRQYVCSEQERACFRTNQILYVRDGQCYTVGEQGPCAEGGTYHVDKREATRLGGHLRGSCQNACNDSSRAPLAATGDCLTQAEVEEKICRREWYLQAVKDAFGEWACEWTRYPCAPPQSSTLLPGIEGQYNGICQAPDLLRRSTPNITIPDERPKDHPLFAYFTANYSEREYACTEEEAACLRYGRVLWSDGNCYTPGQWSSKCEPGEMLHLDPKEAAREGGHLRGTCRSPCKDYKQPQVRTGKCVDYTVMSNTFCRWEWGLSPAQNVFGQLACECQWRPDTPTRPPPTVTPPASTPGYCRAPDFSNTVTALNYDSTLTLGFRLPCTEREYACLREGLILYDGDCYALRTRGPCDKGEELLLDKVALEQARLLAICVPLVCPAGSVLLTADGSCLTNEQVISRLCQGQKVALDEFGGWQCDYEGHPPGNLSSVVRFQDGQCQLPEKYPIVPFNAAAGATGGGAGVAYSGITGSGGGPTPSYDNSLSDRKG